MGCGVVEKHFMMAYGTKKKYLGGSPGVVVMGGDSCFEDRQFESTHHILLYSWNVG